MATYDSSLMRVLRCFSNSDTLGFTKLAELLQFETDLTGYYLRKLQRRELIEKTDRGQYRITPLGKSVLVHVQQLSGLTMTPRISIMLVISNNGKYIVTERTVQPFIGRLEWPTGPMVTGEALGKAAIRTAQERLALKDDPRLVGFFRRIDEIEGAIFDDKLFAVHHLALTNMLAADIASSNQIGKILQLSEDELSAAESRAKSLLDILDFVKAGTTYAERKYTLTSSDLY